MGGGHVQDPKCRFFLFSLEMCDIAGAITRTLSLHVASGEETLTLEGEQRGKAFVLRKLPWNVFKSTYTITFPPLNDQRKKKEMDTEEGSAADRRATAIS